MNTCTRLPFVLVVIYMAACNGPLWQIPGGALEGETEPLNASAIPADANVLALETNPEEHYSVNIGFVVIDSRLYIDPAEGRTWYQNLNNNPLARIRFAGQNSIHPVRAVVVTEQVITRQFDADRIVMRLDPAS